MLSLGDEDVLMTVGSIGEVYKMTCVVNMARGMWQQTHKEQPGLSHATRISSASFSHFVFPGKNWRYRATENGVMFIRLNENTIQLD